MKKKRIVLIIPYYGKLPQYYDAWYESAIRNREIDFIFVSDIDEIRETTNVKRISIKFEDLKNRISRMLGITISLESPYKLCDFKPAYGYLFQEYIKDYEFWGHCDIDLIFGKIGNFITDDILDKYDKIYEHGHFCLYRNIDRINKLFMSEGEYPEYNYQEVFQSPESFYFDEHMGMRLKCRRVQIKTYYGENCFFDVASNTLEFKNALKQGEIANFFLYNKEKLFSVNGNQKKEIMYAHFQKRAMRYSDVKDWNKKVIVIPNKAQQENLKNLKILSIRKYIYKLMFKMKHIKEFWNRYKLVNNKYKSIIAYYRSRQNFKERRRMAQNMLGMK